MTLAIRRVYRELGKQKEPGALWKTWVATDNPPEDKLLSDEVTKGIVEEKHVGHSLCEHGLNQAQRSALHHALALPEGQLMALNGPPGTGKTTWIYALWASLWTKAAIDGEKFPPLVVVASTNNQAVNNVLQVQVGEVERWIDGLKSLGPRFGVLAKMPKLGEGVPSGKDVPYAGWQATGRTRQWKSSFLSVTVDNKTCLENMAKVWCDQVRKAIPNDVGGNAFLEDLGDMVQAMVQAWHGHLCKLYEEYRRNAEQWALGTLLLSSRRECCEQKEQAVQKASEDAKRWQSVADEWERQFALPAWQAWAMWLVRKRPWVQWARDHGWQGSDRAGYREVARWVRSGCERAHESVAAAERELQDACEALKQSERARGKLEREWDSKADTDSRFELFQAAVHYWEGRWLLEQIQLTGCKLDERSLLPWRRLAMLTPCMATTLHSGPKQFTDNNGEPLWNSIDLLIVDESGQVLPALAGGLLALAKRAVFVGDVYQLQPISKMSMWVDKGDAEKAELVEDDENYEALVKQSLWTCADQKGTMPSAMRRAQIRSWWSEPAGKDAESKKENKVRGLWLREHHRCVESIAQYAKDLIYKDCLEPKRPDEGVKEHPWPIWGFAHVIGNEEKGKGFGVSRCNPIEAEAIAAWLAEHCEELKKVYGKESLAEIVAITTPFRAQAETLQRVLREEKRLGSDVAEKMKVGTVHVLQGAERPIVIFSPVVVSAKNMDTPFFEKTVEMLNVAVTRAKDHFWVFGDIHVFTAFKCDPKSPSPSGQLARFLREKGQDLRPVLCHSEAVEDVKFLNTPDAHSKWLKGVIESARERLWILSPFVSVRALERDNLLDMLGNAVQRGVDVRVLIDDGFDHFDQKRQESTREGIRGMVGANVKVHLMPMVHAKQVVVDKTWCAEGSYNWLSAERINSKWQRVDTSHVFCWENHRKTCNRVSKWLDGLLERHPQLDKDWSR